MNKYEYQIPLFGPNYLNSHIVRIIQPNTDVGLPHVLVLPVHLVIFWLVESRGSY